MYLHRREAQKLQEQQADSPRSIESNSSHQVKAHAEGHVEIVLDPEEIPNDNTQLQQGASPDVEKGGDQMDAVEESEESVGCLRKHARFLWTIVQYDNETKRILRLAIPFTCSAMAETISDLVILALISLYLGTDNMCVRMMGKCVSSLYLLPLCAYAHLCPSQRPLVRPGSHMQSPTWFAGSVLASWVGGLRRCPRWEARPTARATILLSDNTFRLRASGSCSAKSRWRLFGACEFPSPLGACASKCGNLTSCCCLLHPAAQSIRSFC